MIWLLVIAGLLFAIVIYDLFQKRHAILRNFPILGHFRYLLEKVGPELRQYIVTSNDEERPFNRDQRRWVYASAKKQNNYIGFGSDNEMEQTDVYRRSAATQAIVPLESQHRTAGWCVDSSRPARRPGWLITSWRCVRNS